MPRDVDVNGSRQMRIFDIFDTSVGTTACILVSTLSSLVSTSKFRSRISEIGEFRLICMAMALFDQLTFCQNIANFIAAFAALFTLLTGCTATETVLASLEIEYATLEIT